MSGTFFAVVGPSGAGKDTVIDYARAALEADDRFAFPTRMITRPADAGGERHEAVSTERFAEVKADGGFLIDWNAHGLRYGVPADVGDLVRAGTSVVVNLSRGAVVGLVERVRHVHVVLVTASAEQISARLLARGREAPDDIAQRIARVADALPTDVPLTVIRNDAAPEEAGEALVDLLVSRAGPAEPV